MSRPDRLVRTAEPHGHRRRFALPRNRHSLSPQTFRSHSARYRPMMEAYTANAIYQASAAYVVSNAAFTTQARKAARQLGVTLAHHAQIARLL